MFNKDTPQKPAERAKESAESPQAAEKARVQQAQRMSYWARRMRNPPPAKPDPEQEDSSS